MRITNEDNNDKSILIKTTIVMIMIMMHDNEM